MKEIGYQREAVLEYAKRWAKGRNPRYLDFEHMGGDCTNFASQCIYAGSGVMNYTPTMGWYYSSGSNRSPSWTGVVYLYNFLTGNKSAGPYGVETNEKGVEPGDIVQLGNKNGYYHSPVVVDVAEIIFWWLPTVMMHICGPWIPISMKRSVSYTYRVYVTGNRVKRYCAVMKRQFYLYRCRKQSE